MIRLDIFGWFDNNDYEKPAHDPGLDTICMICGKKLSPMMKTVSLMKEGDTRSYFYRVHKDCYLSLTEEEILEYEGSLIDNI